jgi:hypothetical protein
LLALLVYAYCTGQRSSRQIERLCEVDVAYRVISANLAPDHTTIARFRQDHQGEAVQLFTDVLVLCAECGLASVGVIAVDGTKIAGSASLKANRTREQIEREVATMVADAERVDAGEDDLFGGDRGDELPVELADPASRKARLDAALVKLERERRERAAEQHRASDARVAFEAAAAAKNQNVKGRAPFARDVEIAEAALQRVRERYATRRKRIEDEAAAKGHRPPKAATPGRGRIGAAEARLARAKQRQARWEQQATSDRDVLVNVTDLDSRIMKCPQGWLQGFNAQAAVNDHGIVLAADVTSDGHDFAQCAPMIAATQANLAAADVTEPVGIMLFDAGYFSDTNITTPGPDRLIATGKAWKLKRKQPTSGEPADGSSPIEKMEHRLRTPEGAALYAKRQHTVEPVFGTIKEARGYRRFTRRGLTAVQAEWQLITAAHNIIKAHHRTA